MAVTLNLNLNAEGDEDLLMLWNKWNFKPSKATLFGPILKNGLWTMISKVDHKTIIKNSEYTKDGENCRYLIPLNDNCYVSFVQLYDSELIQVLNFYYDHKSITHKVFYDMIYNEYVTLLTDANVDLKDVLPSDYYEAVYDNNSYSLVQKNIPVIKMEFELSYSSDIIKKHSMVFKKIEQNENGIISMYGPEGSGKTFYLSHLIKQLNMQVILCPTILLDNTWNLQNFLSWVKKHKDIILVFEDCESYLENGTNKRILVDIIKQSMNSLDSIGKNIYFIFTFNTNAEINPLSELTKTKNILEYRFHELHIKQANKLATKLKKQAKHTSSALLKDVYTNNIKKSKNSNQLGY